VIAFPDSACPGSVVDALLQPLSDNGGPTKTFALASGSPAIDAVPTTGAGCPATDQRGVSRPQGAACDIGAFEVIVPAAQGPPPQQGVPTGPPRATLARLTGMTLSPRAFRAARVGPSAVAAKTRFGTRVRYTLNETAHVRFRVARPAPGRRARPGRCVASSRRNRKGPKCTRIALLAGGFSHAGKSGVNTLRFTGRLAGRRLRPGAYRLLATPSSGGRVGSTVAAGFRILS
jgi:hypothetical protein